MPRKPMPIRELFTNTGERSAGSAVPVWACRRCGWKLVDNATRFARHILRCPSTQPGDRDLAQQHLASIGGTSTAQLEAISSTADEFGRAFTLEGKAHVRTLFEDTQAKRSGEKAKLFRCKRCGHETTENATRFAQHILKCEEATDEDRAIANEHQQLTAKRREMRQARRSSGGVAPLAASTEERKGQGKECARKARNLSDESLKAGRNSSASSTHPSRESSATQDTSSARTEPAVSTSPSHSDVPVEPSDLQGGITADYPSDAVHSLAAHDCGPSSSVGINARAAQDAIPPPTLAAIEKADDITNLDALDCLVDEGLEEELARLSPSASNALVIEHIPAGAQGDAITAALASVAEPHTVMQDSRFSESGHQSHDNNFLESFAQHAEEPFEQIQDLIPPFSIVTTSQTAAPIADPATVMPLTFQKRLRDNNGGTVTADTVSISFDEYQQWKQWKDQMSMPKIIQVPDMEYSMFQNLYSFFIGHAMSCANTYLSHGGFNGPSCSTAMIGQAISEDWTRLASVYRTMVTCCSKAQARYVLEKASTCPERVAGIYNSILSLAQDCVDNGIEHAIQKWSLIPRLDSCQQAVFRGLDKAFQHMTIDENGAKCPPDPKAEQNILSLQHFACTYGPYLRDLYLNNSHLITGTGASFAEQVQQPHFGSSSTMVTSVNKSLNQLSISEDDFTNWHQQAAEFTPVMDEIAGDTCTAIAVTAYMTELYTVAGWDLVLVL